MTGEGGGHTLASKTLTLWLLAGELTEHCVVWYTPHLPQWIWSWLWNNMKTCDKVDCKYPLAPLPDEGIVLYMLSAWCRVSGVMTVGGGKLYVTGILLSLCYNEELKKSWRKYES